LTDLLRAGAEKLIYQAVEAELQEQLVRYSDRRTGTGLAGVVRNGFLPARELQTNLGPVTVRIPKIRSKTGEPVTFQSVLVPPYVRKTKTLAAALPWLYLKGVSSGEMAEALKVLVGPQAQGLSASTVSRLKQVWADEYHSWCEQRLDKDRWVYIWADGVYSGLRAEQAKLCALVVMGVNERGEKHFLAIEDGVRESTQSWREVLLKLKSRGMNAPKLAVGDGAMGFWAALDEVYPVTGQQRCWVHKTMNVLNCLPKTAHVNAKQALHAIWQAETKENAEKAFDLFIETYDPKYPKATLCLQKDRDELMAFFGFPAQHWQSIRTSNPIESTFGTIRHRTKRSKGCLTRNGMLHMMFKLGMCAEKNWRRLRGFNYLAKVITGIKFKDGVEVTEVDQVAA
jgi:transposase-like protein